MNSLYELNYRISKPANRREIEDGHDPCSEGQIDHNDESEDENEDVQTPFPPTIDAHSEWVQQKGLIIKF